jgi:hypothetical protein
MDMFPGKLTLRWRGACREFVRIALGNDTLDLVREWAMGEAEWLWIHKRT